MMTRELEDRILRAILKFAPPRENDDPTTAFGDLDSLPPTRSVEPDDGLGPFWFSDAMADETADAMTDAAVTRRARRPSLARALKEARRAGEAVRSATVGSQT
jgi:hypothetical protein